MPSSLYQVWSLFNFICIQYIHLEVTIWKWFHISRFVLFYYIFLTVGTVSFLKLMGVVLPSVMCKYTLVSLKSHMYLTHTKKSTHRNQSTAMIRVMSSVGSPTEVSTITMVTRPAWGIPAAPMLAAVAVMLENYTKIIFHQINTKMVWEIIHI